MTTPTTGRHRGEGRASRARSRTSLRARTRPSVRSRLLRWDPLVVIYLGGLTLLVVAITLALWAVNQ